MSHATLTLCGNFSSFFGFSSKLHLHWQRDEISKKRIGKPLCGYHIFASGSLDFVSASISDLFDLMRPVEHRLRNFAKISQLFELMTKHASKLGMLFFERYIYGAPVHDDGGIFIIPQSKIIFGRRECFLHGVRKMAWNSWFLARRNNQHRFTLDVMRGCYRIDGKHSQGSIKSISRPIIASSCKQREAARHLTVSTYRTGCGRPSIIKLIRTFSSQNIECHVVCHAMRTGGYEYAH